MGELPTVTPCCMRYLHVVVVTSQPVFYPTTRRIVIHHLSSVAFGGNSSVRACILQIILLPYAKRDP